MNHSYTDIQLNTLKSFRSLLRKLDSLHVSEFSTTRPYVKNQKMFVQKQFDSSHMTHFYNYYMHDDGLNLDVKHQILQDTIDDWVALRLHFFAPDELFSLNTPQMGQFSKIKHFVEITSESDPQYLKFLKSLESIGEHVIDEHRYLDFALKQVVRTANQVCATLNTISNDSSQHLAQDNWVNNTQVSSSNINMSERVLGRRDHTTDNISQGRAHEY